MDYDDLKTKKGREFWGRPFWTILHCIARRYQPEQAPYIINLLKSLTFLLPCDECKNHLKSNLTVFPPNNYLKDSDTLSLYIYTLHDTVNQQINKRLKESGSVNGAVTSRRDFNSDLELKISPPYNEVLKFYDKVKSNSACDCVRCEYFWVVIHSISTTYSPESAQAYVTFMKCMCVLFPCDECRQTFCKIISQQPPNKYLTNNNDTFFWSYFVHDLVNKMQHRDMEEYSKLRTIYFKSLKNDCKSCSVS